MAKCEHSSDSDSYDPGLGRGFESDDEAIGVGGGPDAGTSSDDGIDFLQASAKTLGNAAARMECRQGVGGDMTASSMGLVDVLRRNYIVDRAVNATDVPVGELLDYLQYPRDTDQLVIQSHNRPELCYGGQSEMHCCLAL